MRTLKPVLAVVIGILCALDPGGALAQGFSTSSTNWGLPNGGYVDNGVTHGYYVSASTSANSGDNGAENWTLQDMTGDGRPELVITGALNGTNVQEFSPSSNSYWKVYLNNGTDFDTSPLNWGLPNGGYVDNGVTHGYYVSASTSANSGDNGAENWTLQDMTGDGRPELVITGSLNGTNVQEFSPSSNSYWKVYLNNGSGFDASPLNWGLPNGGYVDNGVTHGYYISASTSANSGDNGAENWTLQDMTGDGRPELVITGALNGTNVQEFSPSSNSYWKVYLNNGSGFDASPLNWGLPNGGYVDNGVTHGYYVSASTSANSGDNGAENWTLQDMTGDGRPELVITGSLNGTNVQEFSPSSNSYWKVYPNNGSGFDASPLNWGLPNGGYVDNGVTHGYYVSASTSANSGDNGAENWTLQDMTGDGRPELVITGSLNGTNVQEFSPSSNSYWKVYPNNGSGFDASPLNWGLPNGGYVDNGVTHGYYVSASTSANSGDNGAENWTLQDMTGDVGPELVVTGSLNGTNVQEFSPSSNSYWKVYINTVASGTSELDEEQVIKVFPNPAMGSVVVAADQAISDVRLFDSSGREVLRNTDGADRIILDLNGLAHGPYVLRARFKDRVIARLLVVK